MDTVTVAVTTGLAPPAPEQESENAVVAVSGPELLLPLAGSEPLQPPDAVHAVASVELHVSVAAAPLATVVGAAVRVAVGSMAMVTLATLLVPAEPVQVSANAVLAVSGPELRVPLGASEPLQPPDAVHAVAFVELQVRVVASLRLTVLFAALIEAVGTGALPEEPPHAANCSVTAIPMSRFEKRISPRIVVVVRVGYILRS